MKHSFKSFIATLTAAATALAVVGLVNTISDEVMVAPAQAATIQTSGTYDSGPTVGEPWELTSLALGNIQSDSYTWYIGANTLFGVDLSDPDADEKATQMIMNDIWTQTVNAQSVASKTSNRAYVFPVDTMIWKGAIAAPQTQGRPNYPGTYTPGWQGIWSPEMALGYYGFKEIVNPNGELTHLDPNPEVKGDFTNLSPAEANIWMRDGVDYETDDDVCPHVGIETNEGSGIEGMESTVAHTSAVWNAWCHGIANYVVTAKNPPALDPTLTQIPTGKTWMTGTNAAFAAKFPGAQSFGGPDNPGDYDLAQGFGWVSSLNPRLEVKKQVCVQYDSDGNPTCDNTSEDGWVGDSTYGDNNVPGNGVNGGVTGGVEAGQVPPGTTTLLWRITANNNGNVPLTGVHVAADAITFVAGPGEDPSDQANENSCDQLKFANTYQKDALGNPTDIPLGQGVFTNPNDSRNVFDIFAGGGNINGSGALMPGATMSETCTTVMDRPFTGIVQNTVGLNASFDNPDAPIFPAPDSFTYNPVTGQVALDRYGLPQGDPSEALMYRFVGYDGVRGQVPSNTDSAQVTIPNPMIKLTKWVCELYDVNKNAVCDPYALLQDSNVDTLRRMAGIGTLPNRTDLPVDMTPNSDGTYPYRQGSLVEGSGWVKRDTVPYEADGLWLLLVTNIGNVPVSNVDFTTEYVTGMSGSTDNWTHVPVYYPSTLYPGQTSIYTVRTHAIIDTGDYGDYMPLGSYDQTNVCIQYAEKISGVDGPLKSECIDYTKQGYGEVPWAPGDDVVNTAIATANALNEDGTPMIVDDKQVVVVTNPSTAELNTTTPAGALKVTKWVCSIGTGCSYDLTHAQLQQLTGVSVVPASEGQLDVVQGTPVSGVTADGVEWSWLPETVVGYNHDADWLIVATNIGDVSLVNVSLRDNLSPNGHGDMELSPTYIVDETTPNRVNTSTRVLASGNSVVWAATTAAITSRADNDPGYDSTTTNANPPWNEPDRKSGVGSVVNTAYATGTAWDVVNDRPLQSSPGVNWTVRSNTSSAEVNSIALAIGDWVWFDSNEDGLQGDDPTNAVSGIPSIRVDLLFADGSPVLIDPSKPATDDNKVTTRTDADGFYYFDMLSPGTYRVAFYLPSGYAWTTPEARTGGQDEDPTYVYAARDSNAAYAYPFTSLTDDSPASEDPTDSIRVTKAIDMNVSTLLDYVNHEYVFPTATAAIPDKYKSIIQAEFINPTIDAGIIFPSPELKVTKWICSIYDEFNQPDCADPYTINPDSEKYVWDDLNGYTAEKHELYTGVPAGGWVKEATIPAGATAQWLIVVTNVGGTRLANVTVEDSLAGLPGDPADGRGATGIATIFTETGLTDDTVVPVLEMTGTRVFMMTTENITNQNETVSGITYAVDDENNPPKNAAVGEPTYADGADDVINSVYAVGEPVDQTGRPIMSNDGVTLLPPETSNISTAEVNSIGYAIGDYVWIDKDKNGRQDDGELPVQGATVSLYSIVNGQQSATPMTTTTDEDGFYLFDNLPAGSYRVVFTLPSGYVWTSDKEQGVGIAFDSDADQTTGTSDVVVLGLNPDGTPLTGIRPSAGIGYPVNATWINPTIDAGVQLPTPGLKITKWVCTDFTTGCDLPQGADLTAMAGYDSNGVKAGEGRLGWGKEATAPSETTQVSWLVVVTNTGKQILDDVTLIDGYSKSAGATPVTCDAPPVDLAPGESHAYRCTTASVTNTQPFVTGRAIGADGKEVTADPISGEPAYAVGDDVVNAAHATGTPVYADGTPIPQLDAAGNPVRDANGRIVPVVVQSNVSDAEVDVVGYAVGDYVWFDANANGIQDPNEIGVQGVTVTLRRAADDWVVATTATDENGWYLFDQLNSGSYYVEFAAKDGYLWTRPTQGTNAAIDSDAGNYAQITDPTATSAVFALTTGGENVVARVRAPEAYRDSVQAAYINPTLDAGLIEANPGIELSKFVCVTGTKCTTPASFTSLNSPNSEWAKQTTVAYDTSADWLIVIQNTGNVPLQNVVLIQEDFTAGGSSGFSANDCAPTQVVDFLAPGAYTSWDCTVNHVVNTADLGSQKDVVNTAQAEGTAVNSSNQPLRNPDNSVRTVRTRQDSAEVNTVMLAVGDYVWFDANANGLQDVNETGVEGVTVTLKRADDTVVGTTATDENGWYLFDQVVPGNYYVEFTAKDGYVWTTPTQGTNATIDSDAGNFARITDPVARSSVFVLDKGSENVVARVLAPLAYRDTVTAAYINPTLDAGLVEANPGIELSKYVCATGTGCAVPSSFTSLDAPDPGWVKATTVVYDTSADWLVVVQNTGNVTLQNVDLVREDFTAGSSYGFDPNDCTIGEVAYSLMPGAFASWTCQTTHVTNTADLGSHQDVVNTAQAQGTAVNSSNQPLRNPDNSVRTVRTRQDSAEVRTEAYAVGDRVWFDANGDGVQDSNENGIADVTVRLLDQNGNPVPGVADVTTDAQGYYWFDRLLPGDYTVEFTLPDGYMWTTANAKSAASATDSDAVYADSLQTAARSAAFSLRAGDAALIASAAAPEDYASRIVAAEINPTLDAGVIAVAPAIELKKFVCQTGTGCPSDVNVIASFADPKGGWVDATTVTYDTNADWLILVANTGNVDLKDVNLIREDLSTGGADFAGQCGIPDEPVASLPVGAMVPYTCTITNVTNVEALGSGKEIINIAQAAGTPVDKTGRIVHAPGKPAGPIPSNTDTARVNSTPKPGEPSNPSTPPPSPDNTPPSPSATPPNPGTTPPNPGNTPPSSGTTPPKPGVQVGTGGSAQPPSQNGWAVPLLLLGTVVGIGALVIRRRFN